MRRRRFRQRGRGREPGDSRQARGSALDESTLVTLALRARDADDGAITDDGPDLAGYDRFITGDGGKEAGR